MLLEYGYRSKCCKAPIRLGKKKIRKTGQEIKVWICCACKTKDCAIVSTEEVLRGDFSENRWENEGGTVVDESDL